METTATDPLRTATWNVTPRSYSRRRNTNSMGFACLELKRDNNEFSWSAHRNVDKDPQYSFRISNRRHAGAQPDVYQCFFGFAPASAPGARGREENFRSLLSGQPGICIIGFQTQPPAPLLNTLFDERDRASYRHVSPIHAVTIKGYGRPISIFLCRGNKRALIALPSKRHVHGFRSSFVI